MSTKFAIIKKESRTCLRSATDFWMSGSARLMQFRLVLEIALSMLLSLSLSQALISAGFAALAPAAAYPPLLAASFFPFD